MAVRLRIREVAKASALPKGEMCRVARFLVFRADPPPARRRGYFFNNIPIVRAIRLTDQAWRPSSAAIFDTPAPARATKQLLELALGPLLRLRCFHRAALTTCRSAYQ